VAHIWEFRELLGNLVHKELKIKYKDSFLGFLWSLLRPLFLLAIYWLVFAKFLRADIPYFAFYLFAGLIAWDLFVSTLNAATTSIVSNGNLIKKVYFPREILPLSAVGAGLVHFALQLVVLFATLLIFGYDFWGVNLVLLPLAIVALVLFTTSLSLLLASTNVYLRDIQHLIEVFFLFWFWLTPIAYPINFALKALGGNQLFGVDLSTIYLLNPMADIAMGFQRAVYKNMSATDSAGQPALYQASLGAYAFRLIVVIVVSSVLVWLFQRVFAKAQGNFAQEL
jgi:ABC-2 type transport system permease protein